MEDKEDENKPFSNGLTAAQAERVAKMAEECAEVIQICAKILAHGYESVHPDKPEGPTNRERFDAELLDIFAVATIMEERGDFPPPPEVVEDRLQKAIDRKLSFMHFQ